MDNTTRCLVAGWVTLVVGLSLLWGAGNVQYGSWFLGMTIGFCLAKDLGGRR